jgi:D-3-phosphoglycerate dehydrogenase
MNIVILEPTGADLQEYQRRLRGHLVTEVDSRTWNDIQVIVAAKDADVVTLTNRPLSAKVIENLPRLQFISVAFAGIDHIDAASAAARHITIKNASGYAKTAVAELVYGLMISLARGIVENANAIRHGGISNTGSELKGKILGIIGMGAIGSEVERLALAFGMEVLTYDRKNGISLEEIFTKSDYVSLHVPLTEGTRGLVSMDLLKLMKKSAFIINTARGPIIDSAALQSALENGLIAGAALDVFDREPPLPMDDPLLSSPHLIATPHLGFNTREAVAEKGRIALENIVQFCAGR